jgi:hypothetical protein
MSTIPRFPAALWSAASNRRFLSLLWGKQTPRSRAKKESGDCSPHSKALWLTLLLLCLFPAVLAADEPSAPRFQLTTTGPTYSGTLDKLAEDWSLRLLDRETPIPVKGAEVVSLRRAAVSLPRHPIGKQIVFANGDRVSLHPKSTLLLSQDRLYFRPPPILKTALQELNPPVATVALIWFGAPDDADDPAVLLRRLFVEHRTRDVILLRNGDRIEGTLTALDRDQVCRLTVGKRRVEVPCARIAAIALNSELLARLQPDGPYAHIVLADGCRLALATGRVDAAGKTLSGKTLFGAAVEIGVDQVAALDVRQGAAVYLSDLEPRRYLHTPFLGVSWPYVKDGTVAGRELSLGGSTYDKGLSMHAESRLTYDLGGRYRRFEAVVGLDERTGKRGRVRLQVLLDGKPQDIGWDRELTGRDEPLRLQVDVRGGRELTLAVLFGRFGDVQAQVNWADARLIKDR